MAVVLDSKVDFEMGRALLTPLYLSIVWILMISYQIYTQIAVETIITNLYEYWPSGITEWLVSRLDIMIFIHAFAWVFVLSSVIPAILLRKGKSVLVQFFVCLILSIVPIWLRDYLTGITNSQIIDSVLNLAGLFEKPIVAALFVCAPYMLMFSLDFYSSREEKRFRNITNEIKKSELGL